jgi:hypothetical protein
VKEVILHVHHPTHARLDTSRVLNGLLDGLRCLRVGRPSALEAVLGRVATARLGLSHMQKTRFELCHPVCKGSIEDNECPQNLWFPTGSGAHTLRRRENEGETTQDNKGTLTVGSPEDKCMIA